MGGFGPGSARAIGFEDLTGHSMKRREEYICDTAGTGQYYCRRNWRLSQWNLNFCFFSSNNTYTGSQLSAMALHFTFESV